MIMMDAAAGRAAPIAVNRRSRRLQLNGPVTATADGATDAPNLGHVVVEGIVTIAVPVNRVMVRRTHMAHNPRRRQAAKVDYELTWGDLAGDGHLLTHGRDARVRDLASPSPVQ
jgi:hypothetical protein